MMGYRTWLCCVLWGALAVHTLAQPIALTGVDKKQLKRLEDAGCDIVRDSPDESTVWVECEPEMTAMQEAVDRAVGGVEALAAAASGTSTQAHRAERKAEREWRNNEAVGKAAMKAAFPLQKATYERLRAAGLAKGFEPASL
jgi:hypothetical protein